MKTYIAQFCLPGNLGIGSIDPDSMQEQKRLSEALALNFMQGKARLTALEQSSNGLEDTHGSRHTASAEMQTIIEINLCLSDLEGQDFAKHARAITEKAARTLRQSKMFLSYLLKKHNTEHIGLDTIFV